MADTRSCAGYSNSRMSYSGPERRRKKNRNSRDSRFINMSSADKAQYLHDHLQRTGIPALQQYTVPVLCDLFVSGLNQSDLQNAWHICRSELMRSADLKPQAHTSHGQPPELPPGGVIILQRPQQQQYGGRPVENQMPDSPEATETAKEELASVVWEDFEAGHLGQFFINKVFFDEENQRSWQAAHLEKSVTKVMTFEELFQFEGLRKMLVVNDRWFGDQQELLSLFPSDVHITSICPMKNPAKTEMPAVVKKTLICPEHYGPDYVSLDPHQELLDVSCGCPKVRSVDLIHPRKNDNMCCTFLILRYDDHLRFVETSASLNRRSWERVAQFGWYHDFPCLSSWAEDSPTEPTMFSFMLSHLLGMLGCDSSTWLERVDFSNLSSQVCLMVNVPGVVNIGVSSPFSYGAKWLRSATQEARKTLKTQLTEKFFQFKRFGHRGLGSLQQVFDVDKPASKMTDVKLVYPSADIAESVLDNNPAELRSKIMGMMYEYLCRFMDEWKNLHNIDDDQILPHANVVSEYTVVDCEDGESRWFGWLSTGSHGISNGAWGGQYKVRQDERFYARYELSVVISPCRDESGTLRAVDLAKVGKHFHSLVPYKADQMPFYPETQNIHDKVRHCIGQLRRIYNKPYGYVDQPLSGIPLPSTFESFPLTQSRHSSAMVNSSVCRRDGLSDLPPDGSVMEFIGHERKDPSTAEWKFRVGRVVQVFNSWMAACEAHGMEYAPVKEPVIKLSAMFGGSQSPARGPSRKRSPDEMMKDLKIQTEEAFEAYWQGKWASWWTMDPFHKNRPVSDSDLDRENPMEPMRLPSDIVWLEKHVRQTCEGNMPELRGPYRINHLQAKVDALWRKQFVGMPRRSTTQTT